MLAIFAALTLFLSSETANPADTVQAEQDQSSPLYEAPTGHGQLFRLLDILSDEERTSFTFELQAADGRSTLRGLSFDNDGTTADLTDESGKQILGYSFTVDHDIYSLDLSYAGRTVKVSMTSDDSGPIEFAFLGNNDPVLRFESTTELDAAIDLNISIQNGTRTLENLDGHERKLLQKANSLRTLALAFLAER